MFAPIQQHYPGTQIHIEKSSARITMPVTPDHFHAAGAMHGSLYFRLLDDSAFFAANSLVEDVFVLTTQFDIQLMRPFKEGLLTAEGKVNSFGKSAIFAESVLLDEKNRMIGRGSGTFLRSRLALTPEIGYQ